MLNKIEKLVICEDTIEKKYSDTISFEKAVPIRFDSIKKQGELLNTNYLYPMYFTQNNLIVLLYNLDKYDLVLNDINVEDEELSRNILQSLKNKDITLLKKYINEMKDNDMEIRFIKLSKDDIKYELYKKGVITIAYDEGKRRKYEVLNKDFLFDALGV
ncbi:hypothetical protein [Staphylococcus haemolyticus]|uniref:hypothetical protein n=1 Tax=Staphylococcus haemolyticus TaxID=1283 RepID=UPI001F0A72D6|nr:hypothetical protein [Staphylococcus haemolyticus]MCH4331180.1 hypothetical protein [Staphylococcus haemolyticus]MCH4338245.1 hypothetical protein [Staphylococcus haemolyticus]MCH4342847.1 hypothetical protein [Staphylococcus haemolyticus]MCH4345187.1 hypothetical protein [Staphylococcus haemolyticus]MCH4395823.1 hypothetical protein [Staphylococcus haemolyticus]